MDCKPTRWLKSPRIVMRCAPRASNGPDHLVLCALQETAARLRVRRASQEVLMVRGPHTHGLSSNKMALITSDCDATRSSSIKWP